MYEVHYSDEAASYLADNGELVANLFFAMESLGYRTPAEAEEVETGLWRWATLGHYVYYRQDEQARIVTIATIAPLD